MDSYVHTIKLIFTVYIVKTKCVCVYIHYIVYYSYVSFSVATLYVYMGDCMYAFMYQSLCVYVALSVSFPGCLQDLSTALTTCRSFLSSIVHAEEDYSRLYHFNQLSIEELKRPLNFHCELQAICNYLHSTGCEVDERLVKNAQVKLELASIVGLTGDLFKIFDLFQIIPSPKDEGYTILMERYKTLTSMNKMDILGIDDCRTFFQELLVFFVQPDTSDSASQSPKLRRTMQMCTPASAHLTTSDKKSVHQLDTGSSLALQMNKCASFFMVLSDSAEFHKFLVERKYKGEGDYAFFSEEVSLIMSHLQHEEHDEEILEHLQVAYRFISPFLNITQNVVDLLKGVRIVLNDVYNSEYDFCQLRTVNNNIDLIRLWFLRMEVGICRLFVCSTCTVRYICLQHMYAYIYTHMHTGTHAHGHTCTHTRTHARMYARMHPYTPCSHPSAYILCDVT